MQHFYSMQRNYSFLFLTYYLLKGLSSVGRAAVSKAACRGFNSPRPWTYPSDYLKFIIIWLCPYWEQIDSKDTKILLKSPPILVYSKNFLTNLRKLSSKMFPAFTCFLLRQIKWKQHHHRDLLIIKMIFGIEIKCQIIMSLCHHDFFL